jgi:proteasome lid subunit RPN8/RPN11
MLLEKLRDERESRKRKTLPLIPKIALEHPFCLTVAKPTRPVVPPDKVFLMEMGLDEIESEILLVLWEYGGKLAIWGRGDKPDLCHELDLTSATIRRHALKLSDVGIVKNSYSKREEYVVAISPKILKRRFDAVIKARLSVIDRFLGIRDAEYEKTRAILQKNGSGGIAFRPKGFKIEKAKLADVLKLADSQRITCGFVTGRINSKEITLDIHDFVPVETKSGKKIHFNPVWKNYHSVKKTLLKEKKQIVGEFHTHPNGRIELAQQDLRKQAMLRRGLWFIVTPEKIQGYAFSKEGEELHVEEICLL